MAHVLWFRQQLCNKNHVLEFICDKVDSYYLQGVTNNGLLQIFPCKMLPKIRIHRINSLYKHLDLVLNMDQLVLLSLQLELKQKTDIEIIHLIDRHSNYHLLVQSQQ